LASEIGKGSFAIVYLGKLSSPDPTRDPVVAIKSVSRDKLNKKLSENLEGEISILKGIRHPFIVGLLEIEVSKILFFLQDHFKINFHMIIPKKNIVLKNFPLSFFKLAFLFKNTYLFIFS